MATNNVRNKNTVLVRTLWSSMCGGESNLPTYLLTMTISWQQVRIQVKMGVMFVWWFDDACMLAENDLFFIFRTSQQHCSVHYCCTSLLRKPMRIYKIRDVVVFCIKYYTRYILDRTRSRISRSRTHELAGCMHAGQLKWSGWWMSSDRSYATRCVTHVAWGNCPRVLVPRLPPPLPRASECLRRAPIHACERPSCSANVEESRVRRFLRRRVLPHSRCLV